MVSPPAGGTLTYRLTVTDNGPSEAYNVVVSDPLQVMKLADGRETYLHAAGRLG